MSYTITIGRTIWRDPESNFAIMAGEAEGELFKDITLKGELVGLEPGDIIEAEGRMGSYRGSPQLEVSFYTTSLPKTAEGMEGYLRGITNVGPKTAEKLVQQFGADELNELLLGEPGLLSMALRLRSTGVSKKAIDAIVEAAKAAGPERELQIFLAGLGMTPGLVKSVIKKLGPGAPALIKANPYELTKVKGIGFLKADGFALKAGVSPGDPRRVQAASLYVLEESESEGHVFLTREQLHTQAWEFLAKGEGGAEDIDLSDVAEAVHTLIAAGRIIDDGGLYVPHLHRAEEGLAEEIVRLARGCPDRLSVEEISEGLAAYEAEVGITLSPDQRAALEGMLNQGLAILRGGPGTGKTTITRAYVEILKTAGKDVQLMAFAGKAAHRQREVCKTYASTIHRALGRDPKSGGFLYNKDCPFEGRAFLIDEVSMIDVDLAYSVTQAIPTGRRLLLVGDTNQLPSVGPGTVLDSLIESGLVPVYTLTEVHRQAAGSMVISGAYEVLKGRMPKTLYGGALSLEPGKVYHIPTLCKDGKDDPPRVVQWALARLRRLGVDPWDVQILSPQKKGPAGTVALNLAMQAWANPDGEEALNGLRVGDRVIQTKNDYDSETWNGDVGRILRAFDRPKLKDGEPVKDRRTGVLVMERCIEVDFLDGRVVELGEEAAARVELAYAVTVHKMQGSECRVVLMVLHRSMWRMLSNAIVYTGMTRAREVLALVGSPEATLMACRDVAAVRRNTHLAERIRRRAREA